MIIGVHHLAISTPDLDRLAAFYCDELGFERIFDAAWEPGNAAADAVTGLEGSAARTAMLIGGNLSLELFEFRAPAPRAAPARRPVCDHGITHLCLVVDDVDAACERIGLDFQSAPQDLGGGVRTVYGRDPDGNIVELKELAGGDAHPVSLRRLELERARVDSADQLHA
jgi:catechol 2,3-dioxygenase-like lactoylglutathione lyase family enzyme